MQGPPGQRGTVPGLGGIQLRVGLDADSVVNCDGLHTIAQSTLTTYVGEVGDDTLRHVCSAINYALNS
jgi:mRNA-degrading endonuclease toxin of MazEF toxin-antitoxin module